MTSSPSDNENSQGINTEMTDLAGFTFSSNRVQSPDYLNSSDIISQNQEAARSPDQHVQDPLHLGQYQINNSIINRRTQATIAFHNDLRFHGNYQISNTPPQVQPRLDLRPNLMDEQYLINMGLNTVKEIEDLTQSISKRMSSNQEEETIAMKKKIILEDSDQYFKVFSKPQLPENINSSNNLIVFPFRNNADSLNILRAGGVSPSIAPTIRNSEEININIREREREQFPPPMETCFKIDLVDKTLSLLSHKLKTDTFKAWKELERVKEVALQFKFFNLKEDKLVKNLEKFFDGIEKLEKITIDFRYLKYDAKLRDQYEERLNEILKTSFAGQNSLENVKLFWTRPDGVEKVVGHILELLRLPTNPLRHLRLNLEGTQLPYNRLKELIQHVQVLEQNFESFRLSADVNSPEAAPIAQSKLNMPNVKDFALNLTCLGPFSADLMNFITKSVATMTNITSLELKLIIKDFTGQENSEDLIRTLFSQIQGVTNHLQELKVIISLEKKDEAQDEKENLEKLIKLVVQTFSPQKIKDFSIGTNPENVKTVKKKKKIGEFWREEMTKIQESRNN